MEERAPLPRYAFPDFCWSNPWRGEKLEWYVENSALFDCVWVSVRAIPPPGGQNRANCVFTGVPSETPDEEIKRIGEMLLDLVHAKGVQE